ncbi:hypothetical protein F4604DRAFT_1685944 [Suillus subluteus]|nr:hypothetical protein F4604DRAFT_1685944 [Suillus subluteus]
MAKVLRGCGQDLLNDWHSKIILTPKTPLVNRPAGRRYRSGDRLKRGVNGQGATAKEVLNNCGIETQDLRDQWADQKKSQLSIHAHMSVDAPARLKKELDVVLTLQADLDASEKALQATHTFYFGAENADSDLQGTKLHQQTHKAIVKRQPALMTAICKFNSYCECLESLFDPSWGVPLPAPLPTKLADLHNDQTLMEDVWITPSVGDVPHWIEDVDVRDGIRALLKQDWYREEQCCLGLKVDNLCRWFRDELTALELTQQRDHVLQLQSKWVTPLASSTCFATNASIAVKLAITLAESKGPSETTVYNSIPISLALPDPSPEDDTGEDYFVAEEAAEDAVLSDILPDSTVSDDKEETVGKPEFIICWELPEDLHMDAFKLPRPKESIIVPASGTPPTQVRPVQDGFPLQVFKPRDMSLLAQPTARLNDVCINGCMALLYSETLRSSYFRPCAILSTHDLPHIRYNAADEILWWNTSWTSFWEKDI